MTREEAEEITKRLGHRWPDITKGYLIGLTKEDIGKLVRAREVLRGPMIGVSVTSSA